MNHTSTTKIGHFGAKKDKNYRKYRLKLKVRIDGMVENGCCLVLRAELKTAFEPYLNPKTAPCRPQNGKYHLEIGQNQKSKQLQIRIQTNRNSGLTRKQK